VKANNVAALMAEPDIDGALVGAASLVVDEFAAICRFYDLPVL
jgi:triosephosphate isomerase